MIYIYYNNKITQNATVLYTINSMFKMFQYKKKFNQKFNKRVVHVCLIVIIKTIYKYGTCNLNRQLSQYTCRCELWVYNVTV